MNTPKNVSFQTLQQYNGFRRRGAGRLRHLLDVRVQYKVSTQAFPELAICIYNNSVPGFRTVGCFGIGQSQTVQVTLETGTLAAQTLDMPMEKHTLAEPDPPQHP